MDHIKDTLVDQFQDTVGDLLVRHRSVLDVLTKLGEAESHVSRAIAKSVTGCGCIEVRANRQQFPEDSSYQELKSSSQTHVVGQLCERDKEILEDEIGQVLFYLAALAEELDVNLYDVLLKKFKEAKTLGRFYLS